MKYHPYPQRDPVKKFSHTKEVYHIDLSYGAIAVYRYLLCIENTKAYQNYACCNTIGKAVRMSENTVCKYVMELKDKQLIRTGPTSIVTKDGRKRNRTLRNPETTFNGGAIHDPTHNVRCHVGPVWLLCGTSDFGNMPYSRRKNPLYCFPQCEQHL